MNNIYQQLITLSSQKNSLQDQQQQNLETYQDDYLLSSFTLESNEKVEKIEDKSINEHNFCQTPTKIIKMQQNQDYSQVVSQHNNNTHQLLQKIKELSQKNSELEVEVVVLREKNKCLSQNYQKEIKKLQIENILLKQRNRQEQETINQGSMKKYERKSQHEKTSFSISRFSSSDCKKKVSEKINPKSELVRMKEQQRILEMILSNKKSEKMDKSLRLSVGIIEGMNELTYQ